MSISPDCVRLGVSPTQGPISFDFAKRVGSSIADLTVKATIGPTPGIVIIRRQTSSCSASPTTFSSSLASSVLNCSRARRSANAEADKMSLSATSSLTRAAYLTRVTCPTPLRTPVTACSKCRLGSKIGKPYRQPQPDCRNLCHIINNLSDVLDRQKTRPRRLLKPKNQDFRRSEQCSVTD